VIPASYFPLDTRALLVATGPQRQKFLHGLLSNDLQSRTPGQGTRAALMDAKGHLLTFLRALVTESEIVLELPADRRDEIHRLLDHYRVAAPVRFAPSADVVIGLDNAARHALDVPELSPESHARVKIAGADVRAVRAGDLPRGGYVLHVPADAAAAVTEALDKAGLTQLSAENLDALRIEEGRAWYGPDVTRDNLLHETGLVAEYHSPSKGCYVGQEVIARLEARGGNVNRRLRGLRLSEARPAGTALRADGKDAGALTTAAASPRLGPIAMGYVHRAHAEPGTVLDADGARAEVTALPMPARTDEPGPEPVV
jgi:tRNA-modifying protein YgfZ